MEAIKVFIKSAEKKFEELENALTGLSERSKLDCSRKEPSYLRAEYLLWNRL